MSYRFENHVVPRKMLMFFNSQVQEGFELFDFLISFMYAKHLCIFAKPQIHPSILIPSFLPPSLTFPPLFLTYLPVYHLFFHPDFFLSQIRVVQATSLDGQYIQIFGSFLYNYQLMICNLSDHINSFWQWHFSKYLWLFQNQPLNDSQP